MHWDAQLDDGRGELLFGRPIRWLLFLYGGRVVPFTIGRTPGAAGAQVLDVESGALTYGHRFLATSGRAGRSIKVRSFDEYQARLAEHFVVLDHAERRDRIARELESHARRLGGRVHLKEHAALIEEVADLVEYPGVVAGFYDRGVPHAAARSADDHAGAPPALLPGRDRKRRAEGSVSRRRQHAAVRRAGDREERRARGDRAAARRQVLLGIGSEDDARVAARPAPHGALSQAAGELSRQGRAHLVAGGVDRARGAGAAGRGRARRAGGAAREGGSDDRHGLRVHRAAGHDRRHLRARGRAPRAGLEGHLLSVPARSASRRMRRRHARSSAPRR